MADLEIDRIDLKILDLLQRDAGLSNLELADRVGLTATPCARRVKRLEAAGVMSNAFNDDSSGWKLLESSLNALLCSIKQS